jgi:hypothetical protein
MSDDPVQIKHEPDGVQVGAIYKFILVLFVVGVVVSLGMWGAFRILNTRAIQEDPKLSRLAEKDQLPPEPRLQVSPIQDLNEILNIEERVLNSYAWVDKNQGIVRIPIDRAMKILIEQNKLGSAVQTQPTQETPRP